MSAASVASFGEAPLGRPSQAFTAAKLVRSSAAIALPATLFVRARRRLGLGERRKAMRDEIVEQAFRNRDDPVLRRDVAPAAALERRAACRRLEPDELAPRLGRLGAFLSPAHPLPILVRTPTPNGA